MKLFILKKGFTLIEIIVSMAIFSVVMVVALGAFLKIVDVNKRAQTVEAAVNNLTFVVESMSRELRTGQVYDVDSRNPSQIDFIGKYNAGSPPLPYNYSYRLKNGVIERGVSRNAGNVVAESDYAAATAANVKITSFYFELVSKPVRMVRIYAAGEVGLVEKAKTTFSVQTAVSQRLK